MDTMTLDSERDLFERELQELNYVEHRLEDVQSMLADEAIDEAVEEFYMGHSETTRDQLDRFDGLFEAVNAEPDQRENATLESLLDEREDRLEDVEISRLHDVVDVETGKAIERLEITKVETLLALADRLGLDSEETEPLRTTKAEAENALDSLEQISLA